jgi:hypothetical protein
MKYPYAVLAFMLAFVIGATGTMVMQEKPVTKAETAAPAPVVSEVDALRLDKLLLTAENLQLRMAQVQTEIQAALKGMERPGYTVSRDPGGAWIYVKLEPKPEPPK